jgi:UrcA family protein
MTNLPRPTLAQRAIALMMATAATIVVVAGSASPAAAATLDTPRTAVIDLSGMDLASRAGEARVADQVKRAARRVCSTDGDRGLAARSARLACIETALATAMPQLAARADAARSMRSALADASLATDTVAR